MADFIHTQNRETPLLLQQSMPILLYFILGLFIIVIVASVGLTIVNSAQEKSLADLTAQIQSKADIQPDAVNQIFLLDSRIANMRSLIARHMLESNIFAFLEAKTYSKVRFTNFSLNTDARKVDMNGETTNYATLAQQINLFQQDPSIEKVDFGGLNSGANNLLDFRLTLIFKPNFFQLTH